MRRISAYLAIVSVVMFLCATTSGQTKLDSSTGRLSVDVADAAENVPIVDAFVLAHSQYGKKDGTAKLTPDHRFEISLEPGVYDVFVAAAGFAPTCKGIEISLGKTTVLKTRLLPDSEHLQQSSHNK